MHYYKRNIGDYHRKAGRLSMLEHGAYTLLIDACYDREKFPTRDQAIVWCLARTAEEIAAVDFVLKTFFDIDQQGCYTQNHIVDDLAAYHSNRKTNKRIAIEREEKRRKSMAAEHEACTDGDEALTNRHLTNKPITNNHKPDIDPAKQSKKITLGKYLEQCKQSGVKAIPADHALFNYCEKQSLPEEFVFICWKRFVDYYRDGAGSKKLYTDWPGTFLNNVKNNYYKLWYLDDAGRYALTTAGKQAQREFAENA